MRHFLYFFFGLVIGNFLIGYSAQAADWPQDAGNAQRTGYTSDQPLLGSQTNWTYQWSWNGPQTPGNLSSHFYDAPKEARPISGGGKVFIPAGSQGLYALDIQTGTQAWRVNSTSFVATAAFSENSVFAGGQDGKLYKINSATGSFTSSINLGSAISKAILVSEPHVYVVTDSGSLVQLLTSNLSVQWTYVSGSTPATPPSYSQTRNLIIFATDDLNVHAVSTVNGSVFWKVKPTPNQPGFPNEFEFGWPVVAEKSNIVFVRMRLKHEALVDLGKFPNTNPEIKNLLKNNPSYQNLFALDLSTGSGKFIPAVGYGGTEDYINGSAYSAIGSMPVVKVLPDGNEVAYLHFRNGQTPNTDYRWDSHVGEMVLNDTTVPGLTAGDVRFIKSARHHQYSDGVGYCYTDITDEQTPLTMAGNTIFNAHWASSCSFQITDRSNNLGLSFSSPIKTSGNPQIIRSLRSDCSAVSNSTHWANCGGLSYITDGGRYFDGPGWYSYYGIADPPGWRVGSNNTAGTAYSAGIQPRYTFVSGNYMIVSGNGGDVMVFRVNNSASSPTPTSSPQTPTPTPVITSNAVGILTSWLSSMVQYDLNSDGKVNSFDFVAWILSTIPTPTNIPTSIPNTPTSVPISTPTLTSTPTTVATTTPTVRTPISFSTQPGFVDVTGRQIVRTKLDKIYLFASLAEESKTLKAYWSNNSLPTSGSDFSQSAQIIDPDILVHVDASYDGDNTVFVSTYTQGTGNSSLRIYPFDLTTNSFKTPITVSTGSATIAKNSSPWYLGSGGVSSMVNKIGQLHLSYWSTSTHQDIIHTAYTYNPSTNTFTQVTAPVTISQGSSQHPHIAISPKDDSVTIAWVSTSTSPAKIMAKTKSAAGAWSNIETVSSYPVWTSTSFGISVDQGPNMVIDANGTKHLVYMGDDSYGRIHYVKNTGTSWQDTPLNSYTHDPAIAIDSTNTLFILGHGHQSSTTTDPKCKSDKNMCYIKSTASGWTQQNILLESNQIDHFDASPTAKWSVVGFNRQDIVEFIYFRVNNQSYSNTTIMYGRI